MKHVKLQFSRMALGTLVVLSLGFAGCDKDDDDDPIIDTNEPGVNAPDVDFYVLTEAGELARFNAMNLSSSESSLMLSGMEGNATIEAIDFRPHTGQLYGLGSDSRLYVINPQNGICRALGAAFTPAVTGGAKGFDFNPLVDRIRIIGGNGQNLRANPETGQIVEIDGTLNGVNNANVNAVAYTDNVAGTASTTLYDIDVETDRLYRQNPPNDGTLEDVGALNADLSGEGSFDIQAGTNTALAVYSSGPVSNLYEIDLETGNATDLGIVSGLTDIIGLAIPTNMVAYGISAGNELVIFDPSNPEPVVKDITNLVSGELILGIDFRPLTGQLYALGSLSNLYSLNASNGEATQINVLPMLPLIDGSQFGFDFNPTVDRIRLVSDNGQNLRLNPNDGTVAAVDGSLPAEATVNSAAYTNNFDGATTTELFVIDYETDSLYLQNPPNDGDLIGIGALGVNAAGESGFDIGGTSGEAWALLTTDTGSQLYSINLQTGAATLESQYTFSTSIRGFTVGLGF